MLHTYIWLLFINKYYFSMHTCELHFSVVSFLRWLEIVFIFLSLVLQIIFQIQFGLWYQCEMYHRNKWNVIKSLHHIFSRNLLPWQPYNAFNCPPKIESYCVIKRTGRWNLVKLLHYMLLEMIFKICKFKKIL